MKLTFLGAARCVTGSKYLLEEGGVKVLVDCGMFQEWDLLTRNWDASPFDPRTLDALVLTHAHLDHCGLIPKLVKEGFRGPIWCTAPTAEIAQIVMEDSGHIQEEDAENKKRRHQKQSRSGKHPEVPLYTGEDARRVKPMFKPVRMGEPVRIASGLTATFTAAGHILGACSVLIAPESGKGKKVLFSGDVGRWDRPILVNPASPPQAEIVVVESTYGDRLHDDPLTVPDQLAQVVTSTVKKGGNVAIPSFAVERSHEVLYLFNELLLFGKIDRVPVFLDSPSAVNVTEVFKAHPEEMDEETRKRIDDGQSPFDFPGLRLTRKVEESKALNNAKGVVIIAGAGMCNGGRIKHHLFHNLPRPESTILFVGHQSVGTLGRQIVDGAKEVRLFGEVVPVKCRIAKLEGFSGHADRDELLKWLGMIPKAPEKVYVTHGEAKVAEGFAKLITSAKGWSAEAPAYRQTVEF